MSPTIAREDGVTPVALMGADEAMTTVEAIRKGMDNVRALLLDLYEREGWRALGYASWRVCVTEEFGASQARVYQLLDAAQAERAISTIVETTAAIRESHLRELAPLRDDAEAQREVWQEVQASPEPVTAQTIREAVRRHFTGSVAA